MRMRTTRLTLMAGLAACLALSPLGAVSLAETDEPAAMEEDDGDEDYDELELDDDAWFGGDAEEEADTEDDSQEPAGEDGGGAIELRDDDGGSRAKTGPGD
jgi:hypothetical protein